MKTCEGVEVQLCTSLTWAPVEGESPAALSDLITPGIRVTDNMGGGEDGPQLRSED
jgi:hypothetical protein